MFLGWGQSTIAKGVRSSSATGYLPDTTDNLHILLNTRVTRILPVGRDDDHKHGKAPDLRVVEFAASAEGQ